MKRIVALAICLGAWGAITPADAAPPAVIAVTSCGQEIPANTIGVLQNDLSCAANTPFAVVTGNKAVVQLDGHTIDGAQYGVFARARHTTVTGPGALTGAAAAAIGSPSNAGPGTMEVSDVDIAGNASGIAPQRGRRVFLGLDTVRFENNARRALDDCRELDGVDVVVRNNGGDGTCAHQTKLRDSVVADNAGVGIRNYFGLTRLTNSTVTGNGGSPDIPGPVDIAAYRKPRLQNTACDHSVRLERFPTVGSLPTAGVCSGD
jgi:hypothetical protein